MVKKKMIQIEEDELRQLLYDSLFLEMLEQAGVDNWTWYGINHDEYVADLLGVSEAEVYDKDLDITDVVDKEIKKYKRR